MCPTLRPYILHWAVPLASLSKYLIWATCEVLPLACCWSKHNNCSSCCLESRNWVPPGSKQRGNQQSLTNLTFQASSTYFYNYVTAHICRDSLYRKDHTSVLTGRAIFNSWLWPTFTISNSQSTYRHIYSEELQQKGGISLGRCGQLEDNCLLTKQNQPPLSVYEWLWTARLLLAEQFHSQALF